jgi:hypothetical protein
VIGRSFSATSVIARIVMESEAENEDHDAERGA